MKQRRNNQTPFFRFNSSRLSRIYTRTVVRNGYKNFKIGDIVRITDFKDGEDYFAQIVNFLVDEYSRGFAFVIWLVPKLGCIANSPYKFESSNYVPFIEEEQPIPLTSCKFECHSLLISLSPENELRNQMRNELRNRIEANKKEGLV